MGITLVLSILSSVVIRSVAFVDAMRGGGGFCGIGNNLIKAEFSASLTVDLYYLENSKR